MQRIAEFQKVSKEQFATDFKLSFPNAGRVDIEQSYERVKLPFRATKGSAGYEILTPCSIALGAGKSAKIPTGLRARIQENWVLLIVPKSGLGFKFRFQLDNTIGIVDSDYYGAENEGHIIVQITNDSKRDKTMIIEAGKSFVQGIFLQYGITEDDEADGVRVGGFGSTGV